MNERGAGLYSPRFSFFNQLRKGQTMQGQIKNALMTTAAVLVTVYVLNQVSFTRGLVQKAITGA